MTNLKRSFFWAAIYLAVVFILGQMDYAGRPVINFANYFYLSILVAIPVTLFFPSVYRVAWYVPLLAWGGVYLVILQTLNRNLSADTGDFAIIVVEFALLETGVWFAYHLAVEIGHAESVMDALARSAFPNRAHDLEVEEKRIKIELNRSRRYHRPLGLVVIVTEAADKSPHEMLKGIQHDLMIRFTSARTGQIIGDQIRQTDLVMRDHHGRFVILCPETNLENVSLLAKRIGRAIEERISHEVSWGVAAFPDEALTFEDLLHKARSRVLRTSLMPTKENEAVVGPN